MDFDALLLSRLQFAFTISFHVTFASLSIGLAAYLVLLEGLWLRSGNALYKRLYDFWVKLFAIAFALGVISGVAMGYQFGTNWSRFAETTANVLGPLFGYEILTAFFLEASFLGIMLFGWRLVGPGLHFLATCIVAAGTAISAFWIIAANSWMQTPAGFELREGVFYATDWLGVVFNPSFGYRFIHASLAAYIATAFIIAGTGAWLLLRNRAQADAAFMLKSALAIATILVPLQLIAGHENGLSVYRTQPLKHAAIEGHWQSYESNAPLILFARPDEANEINLNEVTLPDIGSLLGTGSFDGPIFGLSEWSAGERPSVATVFWAFRLMVAIGLLLLLSAPLGAWAAWRGWLARSRLLQLYFVILLPSGLIALLAGWVTAEAGRQPFTVYGLLRTAESVSAVSGAQVATSLGFFVLAYLGIFSAGLFYMGRIASAGPVGAPQVTPPPPPVVPDETDELSEEELERLTAPDADESDDEETVKSSEAEDDYLDEEELKELTAPHEVEPEADMYDEEGADDEELETLMAAETGADSDTAADDELDEAPPGAPAFRAPVSAHDRLFLQDETVEEIAAEYEALKAEREALEAEPEEQPQQHDEEEKRDGNS